MVYSLLKIPNLLSSKLDLPCHYSDYFSSLLHLLHHCLLLFYSYFIIARFSSSLTSSLLASLLLLLLHYSFLFFSYFFIARFSSTLTFSLHSSLHFLLSSPHMQCNHSGKACLTLLYYKMDDLQTKTYQIVVSVIDTLSVFINPLIDYYIFSRCKPCRNWKILML